MLGTGYDVAQKAPTLVIMMPMPPMRGGSQLASPQADQSIPPAPAPGADISSLLGGGPPAAAMTPNANDLKQAFLEQVRTMSQSAQALAQQYPAFAPFSEAIVKAAQEGMVAVVSQLAAQTPTPNPLALM